MYLARIGLARLAALSGQRIMMGQGSSSPLNADYVNAQRQCAARGGIFTRDPLNYAPGTPQIEQPIDAWYCTLPDPAPQAAPVAAAPVITVTVPTTVSPQVSPSFVQQTNPSNSPVNTAAGQDQSNRTATPTVVPVPVPTAAPAQIPASMPVPSTTGYTDSGQTVTLPTPFGPSTVPVDTLAKYAPWIVAIAVGGVLLYKKGR